MHLLCFSLESRYVDKGRVLNLHSLCCKLCCCLCILAYWVIVIVQSRFRSVSIELCYIAVYYTLSLLVIRTRT
ncbi:hypothetical protein V1507DRAFT_447342 [Lipomyces tetrasporus]